MLQVFFTRVKTVRAPKGDARFDAKSSMGVESSDVTSYSNEKERLTSCRGQATHVPKVAKKSMTDPGVRAPFPDSSNAEYLNDPGADEHYDVASRAEQRERRKTEMSRLRRTIFVGNLPAWMTKRSLHKLFRSVLKNANINPECCRVESVRLRGAVTATGSTSKQAKKRSSIQHEFAAGDRHTQIGFVVLTSTEGISAALKLNGFFLTNGSADTGRHIRVDTCGRSNLFHNTHKTIFVGNLPFSTNEEEVRQVFQSFGKILNVRLIRDSATGAVKGIGFVEFKDPSSISLVIRKAKMSYSGNNSDSTESSGFVIGGRQLRIEVWKSIKKAKKATPQRGNKLGSNQTQKPGASRNSLRVPTNLRGTAARKQFMKRAWHKRSKRKRISVAAGGKAVVKVAKTDKFAPYDGREVKSEKSDSRK
ncbi:unnamed protein product [Hydatigera taeniaeformis]|uniref:RRM domain-containing protein n=1 Tax=Hydatigena taeniaeformis TaxID=6205 RepID=A0A0R3WHU7_HYDTA|nr:unnamed protein product [Hydatigera taeniaeformis]